MVVLGMVFPAPKPIILRWASQDWGFGAFRPRGERTLHRLYVRFLGRGGSNAAELPN